MERRGVRAALVLTRGAEDTLDIRREMRYDIYDLNAEYPRALIPADDRFALSARQGPDGSEWRAIDEAELKQIASDIGERLRRRCGMSVARARRRSPRAGSRGCAARRATRHAHIHLRGRSP